MIIVRRVLAVLLALLLVGALTVLLVVERVNDTALSPAYLKSELVRLDLYALAQREFFANVSDQIVEQKDSLLPESLVGARTPTDERTRQVVLELITTAVPLAYMQALTEDAIDAFLPFFTGETDAIAFVPHVDERLRAVAEHAPGEPSALERAFRDLGLGPIAVEQLVTMYLKNAEFDDPTEAAILRSINYEAEGEWFTQQLFRAIDQVVPYLLGDTEDFSLSITMQDHPALAGPLAPLLREVPEDLRDQGFRFSTVDIKDRLGEKDSPALHDLEHHFEVLRAGWALTDQDLFRPEDRADVDDARDLFRTIRGALRWGGFGVVAALAALIGVLGGRSLYGRLAWGAGALFAAAFLVLIFAGPIYGWVSEPEIREQLQTASEDWSGALQRTSETIIETVLSAAGRFIGGITRAALALTLSAGLLLAVGVYGCRRPPGSDRGGRGPLVARLRWRRRAPRPGLRAAP